MSVIEILKEDIEKALDNRGIKTECPICKNRETFINGQLSTLVPVDANGGVILSASDRNIQTVQLICNKCGHVELFDANILLKK